MVGIPAKFRLFSWLENQLIPNFHYFFLIPRLKMRNWAKIELFWARIQNVPKVIQKRHNRHPHPKIPFISGITEQNRPTIGDYSLGRNWAKIEPFWARIQIQNVPKVTQKCQK